MNEPHLVAVTVRPDSEKILADPRKSKRSPLLSGHDFTVPVERKGLQLHGARSNQNIPRQTEHPALAEDTRRIASAENDFVQGVVTAVNHTDRTHQQK